ncbi:ATP-binding protein [Leptothoe kymatousa]|uniref:histidine kinase n=1 Tax=Leptothoe kymatousa TAU-MAC 1615 TaxID=2364775 RepID=A0ABS5Y461_9CYAN|nr:DAHL domain-containing protein [Leptothoe kymatousa]MBT9312612.1 response regulator [Leptothoe kymatousa TAU-MAC 1615]
MKQKLIILSATAGALMIWGGLLFKGRSIPTGDHVTYKDALAKQLQYDLGVNQAVLEVRQTLDPDHASLAEALTQTEASRQSLQALPALLNTQNDQATQQLWQVVETSNQLLEEKALLSEQFQVEHGQIKESLAKMSALLGQVNADGALGQSLTHLVDQALVYGLSADAAAADLSATISQVQALAGKQAGQGDIGAILQQANVVLDRKPQVDQLTQSLLAVPTTEQLQSLMATYELTYQQTTVRTRWFQLAAIAWGLGMLGAAAYGWQLKKQFYRVEKIADTLFESMDDASVDVDHQWMITSINASALEDLNQRPEDLMGKQLWSVFPKELGQEKKHYYQRAVSQQETLTFETRLYAQERWLELSLTPTATGLSIVWQDISDQKRAEFQLALSLEANDEALKKADEARQKAEAERLKAEQANKAKSDFLANMSHELRTPLNAIIGYSELLEEDAQDMEQTEFIPELKKIQDAGKHLLGLIDGVLDLSKVEAGQMDLHLETFEVMPLVKDVVSTIQPVVVKSNNNLQIQCSQTIGKMRADAVKVRQSLYNLLSNANKFTHNGTITLSVDISIIGKIPWITFQIQDTGIGMLPDQLKRVFNAFAQADSSTTRKYGGTGLGLTITKQFVEMMGGTVDVQSEMGVGTTFTLRIPKTVQMVEPGGGGVENPVESPVEEPVGSSAHGLDRPLSLDAAVKVPELPGDDCLGCVLVIDDDLESCDVVRKILASEGYFVVLSHNHQAGLQMAEQLMPDIILLDVVTSKVDGWEMIKTLRDNPVLAKTPLILHTMQADEPLGNSLGATDYVSKPVQSEDLLTVVEKYRPQHLYAC